MFRLFKKVWIPLLLVVVVALGGYVVLRVRASFGATATSSSHDANADDTKPFNPKHLTYEVFGPPGTVANISYFDVNGDPQRLDGAHLPWSLQFAITAATAVGSIAAQAQGDGDSIGCRIVVDGEVKAEKITHEVSAFTFCMLKAA